MQVITTDSSNVYQIWMDDIIIIIYIGSAPPSALAKHVDRNKPSAADQSTVNYSTADYLPVHTNPWPAVLKDRVHKLFRDNYLTGSFVHTNHCYLFGYFCEVIIH